MLLHDKKKSVTGIKVEKKHRYIFFVPFLQSMILIALDEACAGNYLYNCLFYRRRFTIRW